MATLVLLMSVLAIVGDSLPVACVAPHRASPSLRLAESAMEMFGAADYSLDLELRETAVDATTAGAGARCGAPPPFGVLTSQLTISQRDRRQSLLPETGLSQVVLGSSQVARHRRCESRRLPPQQHSQHVGVADQAVRVVVIEHGLEDPRRARPHT